jgi:hypothetical protein
MICGDEIVGAFLFYVFHSLGIAENGEDEVDEVGESIEGLTDKLVHVGILAKEAINIAKCVVFLPDYMAVENIVEYRDECGK